MRSIFFHREKSVHARLSPARVLITSSAGGNDDERARIDVIGEVEGCSRCWIKGDCFV